MDLKLDQWASAPPLGYPGAIEPSTGKKEEGFKNGEEPTAGHFNWNFQALADLQTEVTNAITGSSQTLSSATTNQLLRAIERYSSLAAIRVALGNWTTADDTAGQQIYDIAEDENGNLLAVGASGLLDYSIDGGDTFIEQTPAGGYSGDFRCCCWSSAQNKWVVGGANGEIQTSPDGTTWTHRSAGSSYSGTFRGAKEVGPSLLVMLAGTAGEIQTSTDLTTFTRRISGGADFVAVGGRSGGFALALRAAEIYRSATGTTGWASVHASGGNNFSEPLPIPGSGFPYMIATVSGTTLTVSIDSGLTWTEYTNATGLSTGSGGVIHLLSDTAYVTIGTSELSISNSLLGNRWYTVNGVAQRIGFLSVTPGLVADGRMYVGKSGDQIKRSLYFG